MLDIKIDKEAKHPVVVKAAGGLSDIINELGLITSDLYHSMMKRDPMMAAAFKWAVCGMMNTQDGKVWEKDSTTGPGVTTLVITNNK